MCRVQNTIRHKFGPSLCTANNVFQTTGILYEKQWRKGKSGNSASSFDWKIQYGNTVRQQLDPLCHHRALNGKCWTSMELLKNNIIKCVLLWLRYTDIIKPKLQYVQLVGQRERHRGQNIVRPKSGHSWCTAKNYLQTPVDTRINDWKEKPRILSSAPSRSSEGGGPRARR